MDTSKIQAGQSKGRTYLFLFSLTSYILCVLSTCLAAGGKPSVSFNLEVSREIEMGMARGKGTATDSERHVRVLIKQPRTTAESPSSTGTTPRSPQKRLILRMSPCPPRCRVLFSPPPACLFPSVRLEPRRPSPHRSEPPANHDSASARHSPLPGWPSSSRTASR